MRTFPLTLSAALAATVLLAGCSDDKTGDDVKNADRPSDSACALGDMGVKVGAAAAPAAGDTGTVTVTLTNKGAQCTLKGFPGVDLLADDKTTSVTPDEGAKAQSLTLAKGATTSFTITYVRGEAGSPDSLAVRKASFTLPGDTKAAHELKWAYGEVAWAADNKPSVSGFETSGD
jgi:outer membrane murein-binding lipoprotein Lpp